MEVHITFTKVDIMYT